MLDELIQHVNRRTGIATAANNAGHASTSCVRTEVTILGTRILELILVADVGAEALRDATASIEFVDARVTSNTGIIGGTRGGLLEKHNFVEN